jgi:hypothetical protein
MDDNRFDHLTRRLALTRSRRGALKLLGGGVVALGAAAVIVPSTRAQSTECADAGESCSLDSDCCGRFYCGEAGTCDGASAGCTEAEGTCSTDDECCGRLTCGDDGKCGGPSAGCTGAEGSCSTDDECCGRLICGEDGNCGGPSAGSECADDVDCAKNEICCGGTCAAIACCIDDKDPNARCPKGTTCFEGVCDADGGGTGNVSTLPATGAGPQTHESNSWLLGAAALGGVAAAAARLRPSRDKAS